MLSKLCQRECKLSPGVLDTAISVDAPKKPLIVLKDTTGRKMSYIRTCQIDIGPLVSQADAQQQAANELAANAQAYSNALSTMSAPISTSADCAIKWSAILVTKP